MAPQAQAAPHQVCKFLTRLMPVPMPQSVCPRLLAMPPTPEPPVAQARTLRIKALAEQASQRVEEAHRSLSVFQQITHLLTRIQDPLVTLVKAVTREEPTDSAAITDSSLTASDAKDPTDHVAKQLPGPEEGVE